MNLSLPSNFLEGWKVLVVDDEPDSVELVKLLLELHKAEVYTASNGQEGFAMALKYQPRFIISDLTMPQANGWEMIDRIKRTPATTDIPVVALTAHAMTGDRERAFGAGFYNYLAKPLRPETFVLDLLNLLVNIPGLQDDLKMLKRE
jgi:CheY-like chemotaxis protein